MAFLIVAAACRSGAPAPRVAAPETRSPPPAAASGWGLLPRDLGTQRLYRVQIRRDGEERSGLRCVLRVWRTDRFELAASDPLGRPLWRLVVADELGVRTGPEPADTCRFDPSRPFVWPGIGRLLPASDLPAVLLGRLPEAPSGAAGAAGRRWTSAHDAEGLAGWTLEDGAVRLEWRREKDGGDLLLAARGIEIRWREVASEPVAGTLPALPPGFSDAPECRIEEVP